MIMEELTIEQKAERYDKALANAKYYHSEMEGDVCCVLEECFSELKESNDENIKSCIGVILTDANETRFNDFHTTLADCLVWLEKQDTFSKKDVNDAYLKGITDTKNEIEKQYEASYQIRKDIATFIFNYRGDIKDRAKWMNYLGIKVSFVEKQNEKEHSSHSCQNITALGRCAIEHEEKSADKVEPKFKVSDWIVYNRNESSKEIFYIYDIRDGRYYFNDNIHLSWSIKECDEKCHLWTIEDAKDGDVLVYKDEISLYKHGIKNCTKQETTFGGFVYHCCYDGKRFIINSLYSLTEQDKMDIHLATKEQRDLLFQKMKKAGYEFDFEKKELKTIEQSKLTEFEDAVKDMMDDYRDAIGDNDATTEEVKKHAAYLLSLIPCKPTEWSEEDDTFFKAIVRDIENIKYISENAKSDRINWLKSLKDRVQPQPKQEWSEEDKGILLDVKCVIDNIWHSTSDIDTGGYSKEELKEMWEWLDKIWQRVEYHEEKQDEQNHAYNVKPKFRIGDTIVEKDLDECGYGTIKDIKDGQYIFTNGSSLNINEQEGWRLVKTSTNHGEE